MDMLKNCGTSKLNSHKKLNICIGILSVIITTGVCLLTVSVVYIANGLLNDKDDINGSLSTKQTGNENNSAASKSDVRKSRDHLPKPENIRHFNLTRLTEAAAKRHRESDAPTNVRVEVMSSTSVHVTWKPPPLDTLRAVFRGYHLFFQEIDDSGKAVEPEQIYLNDKSVMDCEFKVNDLKPNTSYAIQVDVWYGRHGNGEMSTKIYTNTSVLTKKLINVALAKPVIISSGYGHERGGHYAVDGKLSTYSFYFTHTHPENSPWLKIDLKRHYVIQRVTLVNRLDCCGERLHDVIIKTGPRATSFTTLCGEFRGPGTEGQRVNIDCPANTRGRFILVLIQGKPGETDNSLNLNEVEVFAYE